MVYRHSTISPSLPTSLNHFPVTPNFTEPSPCRSQLHSTVSPSLPTSLDHFFDTPSFTGPFPRHSQLHSTISPSLWSNSSSTLCGSVFAIFNLLVVSLSTTFLLRILKINTFLLILTFSTSHVLHFLLPIFFMFFTFSWQWLLNVYSLFSLLPALTDFYFHAIPSLTVPNNILVYHLKNVWPVYSNIWPYILHFDCNEVSQNLYFSFCLSLFFALFFYWSFQG